TGGGGAGARQRQSRPQSAAHALGGRQAVPVGRGVRPAGDRTDAGRRTGKTGRLRGTGGGGPALHPDQRTLSPAPLCAGAASGRGTGGIFRGGDRSRLGLDAVLPFNVSSDMAAADSSLIQTPPA